MLKTVNKIRLKNWEWNKIHENIKNTAGKNEEKLCTHKEKTNYKREWKYTK